MGLFWARQLTLSGLRNQLSALGRQLSAKQLLSTWARSLREGSLPPVMCERLIGFRHPVHIFFLLDRGAFATGSVEQFIGQLFDHSLFAAATGITDEPANRERRPAVGIHLDRHLVIGAANATSLYFEQRLGILHGFFEELQPFIAALLLDLRQRF